ncbi:MAG: outer membrane beta-barrel domain-containing protein [Pseudomonadota bacterium]
MESRLLLLFVMLCSVSLPGCALFGAAPEESVDDDTTPVVIDPGIERRDVKRPDIDRENFELSAYAGLISIEDFGTNTVAGARVAFHITEDVFIEAGYGASEGEETSFELLSGNAQLLTESEREFTYYNASLGYNVLPGEVFFWGNRAFSSSLYLIAGVGSTEFAGDDRFTINVGAGLRVLLNDLIAVRLDVRDHLFDTDLLGTDKTSHNIEYHLGFSLFF